MKRAAAWMNDPQNREATVDILAAATNTAHDICEASYDFIIKDMKAVPADLAVTQAGLEDIVTIDAAVNWLDRDTAAVQAAELLRPELHRGENSGRGNRYTHSSRGADGFPGQRQDHCPEPDGCGILACRMPQSS